MITINLMFEIKKYTREKNNLRHPSIARHKPSRIKLHRAMMSDSFRGLMFHLSILIKFCLNRNVFAKKGADGYVNDTHFIPRTTHETLVMSN